MRALARRAFRDARIRTLSFACLFGAYSYVQPLAYREGYPTLRQPACIRPQLRQQQGDPPFLRRAARLATVNGYAAWRVGGTLAIFAAIFGLLAAVRALRTEEDTGRMELVLAGPIAAAHGVSCGAGRDRGRRLDPLARRARWFRRRACRRWRRLPSAGDRVGHAGLRRSRSDSEPARPRPAASRSSWARVSSALLFLLRVVADTASGLGWLRWADPAGWAEELRPFAGPTVRAGAPWAATTVLLLPRRADRRHAATSAPACSLPATALSPSAAALLAYRAGAPQRARQPDRLAYQPSALSRSSSACLAKSISSAGVSKSLHRRARKLGAGSILDADRLSRLHVHLLHPGRQPVRLRTDRRRPPEEADGQLETLLALPVCRRSWLAGRLALAAFGAAGDLAHRRAAHLGRRRARGRSLSLPKLLEAGANCMPVAILSLGIAALAYAIVPRASAGIAYGLVTVAFLWETVGSLLGAPTGSST